MFSYLLNVWFINTFLINLSTFLGDNVDCWMEIQHGKGPWAPPVSGIVPLGSTLTLVVAINDYRGKFQCKLTLFRNLKTGQRTNSRNNKSVILCIPRLSIKLVQGGKIPNFFQLCGLKMPTKGGHNVNR